MANRKDGETGGDETTGDDRKRFSASKEPLPDDTGGQERSYARRNFMKLAGTAVVGLGVAASSASAAGYDTVTVGAGESKRYDVGSGETLENLLIDVTASEADLHISASGSDWTIRNIGVKGSFDIGDGDLDDGPSGFDQIFKVEGKGLMENIYLGDGVEDGFAKSAMNVPHDHADHITCRNMNVGRWSSNAIYAAGFGRIRGPGSTDGAGGSISFDGCLFENNNVAHLRLAADGTEVKNCVFRNTGNVPPLPLTHGGLNNVVNSRGIYTGYGDPEQTISVQNCDFDITSQNTCGSSNDYNACAASAVTAQEHGTYGATTIVSVADSQVNGKLNGDYVKTSNVGDNPDTTPPSGVPTSAEAAASGEGFLSGGASKTETSADSTTTDSTNTISISGGSASNVVSYSFDVSDTVEKSLANGGTITSEDTITGTSVEGKIAGGTDSFDYTGDLTSFTADDGATVTHNGTEVDPASLVTETETETATQTETPTDDGSSDSGSTDGSVDEDVLVIDGTNSPNETARYTFTVSGEVTRNVARSTVDGDGTAWDRMLDTAENGRVVGIVGNGVDAYSFTGRITNIDIRGDASFTVIRS